MHINFIIQIISILFLYHFIYKYINMQLIKISVQYFKLFICIYFLAMLVSFLLKELLLLSLNNLFFLPAAFVSSKLFSNSLRINLVKQMFEHLLSNEIQLIISLLVKGTSASLLTSLRQNQYHLMDCVSMSSFPNQEGNGLLFYQCL